MTELLRALPSVDAVAADPRLAVWRRDRVVAEVRGVLDGLRQELRAGTRSDLPDVAELVRARLESRARLKLRRVINATGIVLHTNMGRAPLAPEAAAAVAEVAAGYCNVELDLASGTRGGRLAGVREPLLELLGCEDAIVVNNGAAAVVLVLAALATGREVVVSRGELVEIGGSFRVPEIMAASGATLREVGTTNRTRAADYARAIGPATALLMRIHPSNFRMIGFTERPTTASLAALGVPLVEDLGSGALRHDLQGEAHVAEVLAEGAALVTFSGDKLLGGPQAGIIAGRAPLVEACRRHPLYRAMRLDKLVLAALEATLRLHLDAPAHAVPALRLLADAGGGRADALCARLRQRGVAAHLEDDEGFSGGGALPMQPLASRVVVLPGTGTAMAEALRAGDPPVVARVARDAVRLDLRTVLPGEEDSLFAAVLRAAGVAPAT